MAYIAENRGLGSGNYLWVGGLWYIGELRFEFTLLSGTKFECTKLRGGIQFECTQKVKGGTQLKHLSDKTLSFHMLYIHIYTI